MLDETDTFSQTSETTQGSAEVNLMVTHQAAEVANAAKAAAAAAEQLEDTRRNYKAWQQQQDSLTAQITKLESELAQDKPGVTQGDVDDLRTQLDILNTDEAWHLANIAVAVDNAATASMALYQQGVTAANSSLTMGFNAGLELNVSATHTKTQVQDSYSVGSVLSGSGVYLNTGDDGQLLVKGSAIDSSGAMALNVGSLVMQAGVNTQDSSTQTQQGNLNISQTVWGAAAGGPVVNASYNQSEQRDHSTSYTNASLTAADTLLLNVKNDASLIGATIHADKGLTANIGGNLTLESLQNLAYGSSKGVGVSGGVGYEGVYTNEGGAGADPENVTRTTAPGQTGDAATANGGVSLSNSSYYTKETVLSSITSGGPLNIDVAGHTDITGALIASIDESGKDTGLLSLNTGSLSFTDLKNTHQSSNSTVALNTNVLLGDDKAPEKGTTNPPQDSKGEDQPSGTTNLGIHQNSSQSAGKTLATIGNGSITVGGEATTPEGLNRDVEEVEKELYAIDRVKGDFDLTVENKTIEEVAEAVVQVKRELQAWAVTLPPEVNAALPGMLEVLKQAVIDGKDISKIQEALESDDVKRTISSFAKYAEQAEKDPEKLQKEIEEGMKVKFITDDQGTQRIQIVDTGKVPAITELVEALNSINKVLQAALTEEQKTVVDVVVTVAGGPASLAIAAITKVLEKTDEGRAVLAHVEENKEHLGNIIGAAGARSGSVDNFTEDLAAENRDKNSDFFSSMQGGGMAAVDLATLLIALKGTKAKGDSESDEKESGAGNSSGAENSATYASLKESLAQQNLSNIAAQDPRLAIAVRGDGSGDRNFAMGEGTRSEADRLGMIWVGDGARPTTDGTGLVSADGTRVYRYPAEKKDSPYATTGTQANFETLKIDPKKGKMVRVSNGHLNIE